MILGLAIASGLLTLFLTYWVIFSGWDDLCECIMYALKPDIISWFRGELSEDWWAELKVFVWLLISTGVGTAIYRLF